MTGAEPKSADLIAADPPPFCHGNSPAPFSPTPACTGWRPCTRAVGPTCAQYWLSESTVPSMHLNQGFPQGPEPGRRPRCTVTARTDNLEGS
jgi:hypothetical protein